MHIYCCCLSEQSLAQEDLPGPIESIRFIILVAEFIFAVTTRTIPR